MDVDKLIEKLEVVKMEQDQRDAVAKAASVTLAANNTTNTTTNAAVNNDTAVAVANNVTKDAPRPQN